MRIINGYILLVMLIISSVVFSSEDNDKSKDIKAKYLLEYEAYLKSYQNRNVLLSDVPRESVIHLQKIGAMGVDVLPYIFETLETAGLENPGDFAFTLPLWMITKKHFLKDEWPGGIVDDSRTKCKMYMQWWKKRGSDSYQKFQERYSSWKSMKKQNKVDEAKNKYIEIQDIGVEALPFIMEKIKLGDSELIEIVSELTYNEVPKDASAKECLDWWDKNREDFLIPFPNKQPKADAGKDQTVISGDKVMLDGSSSSDPDKDKITYKWTQTSGPSVKLSNDMTVKPNFAALKVKEKTILSFQLIVNDGYPKKKVHPSCESGQSEPDIVNIIIVPKGTK